jgi:hypothetical protein
MSMDFNNAESNNSFDLIPVGTVAPLIMTIRPGKHGDGGWETASNSSDATYLNCEFTVTAGPFKSRKFWGNMVVSGGKKDESGNSIAGNISRSTLRGILESSRKIKPADESEAAQKARMVDSYGDFSGMEFVGKIGIEKGTGQYEDKNKLTAPVPVTSAAYATAGAGSNDAPPAQKQSAAASGGKPSWAQ